MDYPDVLACEPIEMVKIHVLPIDIINKIAAGEVLEKPANAVKELVENAIDAGSTSIKVELEQAGRNLIRITDNGIGISKEDLPLAIEKHATSKLNTDDLSDINYLGFRGEALHSIAVTSEMKIASYFGDSGNIMNATTKEIKPHHIKCGTIIEIRNLFHNIPNKLRFLRSEKTELSSIIELFNKLALVNPGTKFELISNNRQVIEYQATTLLKRMEQMNVLGKNFVENLLHVKHSDGNLSGELFFGLPTLTQKKNNCFTFINNRPVKDGMITSVIRHAYNDYIPKNTYPIAVTFIKVPNSEVDVNIHPNKSEVKFQDPQAIRRFIISGVKTALSEHGQRTSTTIASHALSKFSRILTEKNDHTSSAIPIEDKPEHITERNSQQRTESLIQTRNQIEIPIKPVAKIHEEGNNVPHEDRKDIHFQPTLRQCSEAPPNKKHFETFGVFKCQIHGTFIITETETEMIIIDQHAAHERVLYEQMKKEMISPGQTLLISEFVPLSEKDVEILHSNREKLKEIGLVVERTSHCSVMVNSLPQILKNSSLKEVIEEISSLLEEEIDPKTLIERIYANIACKKAIKANHTLTQEEIEELLTLMEQIPHTGQCNHGRPTHVRLPLKEIEKLFLRS